jgi:hypothetical protein
VSDKIEQAKANMVKNLEEKTGRPLADWLKFVRGFGPLKHGEVVKRLKAEHGLTHGYANMVALTAAGSAGSAGPAAPAGDDLVAAQYAGDKAGLRPVYDKLLAAMTKFGPDVEASPKKAYVSVRRAKQFAIVQPTTKTRLDVGINLKGVAPAGRLEASGSFNAMVTHRVRVESAKEVDAELLRWLKSAYDAAG